MPQRFPAVRGVVVDPDRVIAFLRVRRGPDGKPVSELIGNPQAMDEAWFRCKWLGTDNAAIAPGTNPHWEPAWHGCKLEALYSIMYHGELFESSDDSQGQRYITEDRAE